MAIDLNDTGERIRLMIWSGFYTPEDVFEVISEEYLDPYELSADDRAWIDAKAEEEAEAKLEAEQAWPDTTDWDRLDAAFNDLDEAGILGLHNAGVTQSEGLSDAADIAAQMKDEGYVFKGFVFYNTQDIDRAQKESVLNLTFGAFDGSDTGEIAQQAGAILTESGFDIAANPTPETGITLNDFTWQKRGLGEDEEDDEDQDQDQDYEAT
ncbi:MAG: DUF6891 domain-containing protein [Hyphomicrobiaceae bacterium]